MTRPEGSAKDGFYGFLLRMALAVFVLCLVLLPFLPRSSPEFVVTAVSLAITGALAAVCAYLRRAGGPALADSGTTPGRPKHDDA
ncbi:MAG: hypothetical protein ABII00_08685 [Elusimicrobiota bacterium]